MIYWNLIYGNAKSTQLVYHLYISRGIVAMLNDHEPAPSNACATDAHFKMIDLTAVLKFYSQFRS
jgi:hypothetical protein